MTSRAATRAGAGLREAIATDAVPFGRVLTGIAVFAFGLRGYVAFFSGLEWLTPDSERYLQMARGILAGEPEAFFPNGYPLLVAGWLWAMGETALPAILIALNAAASTASVVLTACIARRVTGRRIAGLAAGVAIAVYPNQLVYTHYVLTEAIATALLLAALEWSGRRREGAAGLALGLAVLFRTALAPAVAVIAALTFARPGGRRSALALAAGLGAIGVAYGALVAGGIVLPSDNARINLLFAIHSPSHDFEFSNESFSREERAHPVRTYARFAVTRPAAFAAQRVSSLWELWGPYPTDHDRPVWVRLALGIRFPLVLLACAGLALGRRRFEVRVLGGVLVANTALHVALFSEPRFTYTSEPVAIALAAVAVVSLLQRRSPATERDGPVDIGAGSRAVAAP